MKKLLTNKKLMSMLSLVLVVTMMITNINLGGVRAKAETGENRSTVSIETKDGIKVKKTGKITKVNGNTADAELTFEVDGNNATVSQAAIGKTDIVLVVDLSGSMDANGKDTRVQTAANSFVDTILTDANKENVRMAVVSYQKAATTQSVLTNSTETLKEAIGKLDAPDDAGTNIQAGLKTAKDMLSASDAVNKIVILLSDGEPTYSFKVSGTNTEKTALNTEDKEILAISFDYSNTKGSGNSYTYSNDVIRNAGWYTENELVTNNDSKVTYRGNKVEGTNGTIKYLANFSYDNAAGYTRKSVSRKNWFADWKYQGADGNKHVVDGGYVSNSFGSNSGYVYVKEYVNISVVYHTAISFSNNGIPTISEAQLAKNAGIDIYTIGYDVANNSNAQFVMKNVASSLSKYYTASVTNTSQAIENVLANIATSVDAIIEAAKGARLVDELPPYMKAKSVDKTAAATISADAYGNNVSWNLGDLGKNTKQTLKITCEVNLDGMCAAFADSHSEYANADAVKAAISSGAEVWFDLNKLCTLTYTDKDNNPVSNTSISSITAKVPQGKIDIYKITVSYYEDGVAIPNSTKVKYGYKGQTVHFDQLNDYTNDTVNKYNKTKTKITGSASLDVVADKNKEVRVDYYKNEFDVVYYDTIAEKNVKTVTVKYGDSVKAADVPAVPTHEGYKDGAWDTAVTSLTNITKNYTVKTTYSPIKSNVTYKVYIDDILVENVVENESNVAYNGNVPLPTVDRTKYAVDVEGNENTDKITYSTNGWTIKTANSGATITNGTITGIKKDLEVEIRYTKNVKHPVVFKIVADGDDKDAQGHVYDVQYVAPGQAATAPVVLANYAENTDNTNKFTYSITDWNADFTNISAPTVVVATRSSVYVNYTITFEFTTNYGGDKTETVNTYHWGDTPTLPAEMPTAQTTNNQQYSYSFTGWPTFEAVEGNKTYTANETRTTNQYTYSFKLQIDDGAASVKKEDTVDYGTVVTAPAIEIESRDGFSPVDEGQWTNGQEFTITDNTVDLTRVIKYNANNYNVQIKYVLKDEDGNTISEESKSLLNTGYDFGDTVEFPTIPTKTNNKQYSYSEKVFEASDGKTYDGSDFTLTTAANLVITITQVRTVNKYDVTFIINDDDSDTAKVVTKSGIAYGTSAVAYAPELPTVAGREAELDTDGVRKGDKWSYAVSGWDVAFDNITDDTVVTANITKTDRLYTVSYVVARVNSESNTPVEIFENKTYGTVITAPAVLATVDATGEYTYSISYEDGWTANAAYTITGNKTFVATESRVKQERTVNFIINYFEGSNSVGYKVVDTVVVKYGETATAPVIDSSYLKEDTAEWNWPETITAFADQVNVTTSHDVEVNYVAVKQQYTVKFLNDDNTEISNELKDYGFTVERPVRDAEKEISADGQFYYTFDEWKLVDGEEVTTASFPAIVTKDLTFKASFNEDVMKYDVFFVDAEGDYFVPDVPYVVNVTWGAIVPTDARLGAEELASQSAITRSNPLETVHFTEWTDKDGNSATEAVTARPVTGAGITFYASYGAITNTYDVIYHYENGDAYGEPAKTVAGQKYTPWTTGPEKESTKTINYNFVGWVAEARLVEIVDDMVPSGDVPVVVEPAEGRIGQADDVVRRAFTSLAENNGVVVEPDAYASKVKFKLIVNPENAEDIARVIDYLVMYKNVDLYPMYQQSTRLYTVKFVDYDGRIIKTEQVEYEHAATAPANPTRGGYTFTGWDKTFDKIVEDTTVTAKYQANGGGYYIPPTPTPTIDTGDDPTPQGSIPTENPQIIVDGDDETPQGSIPETQQDMELEDDGQALGDALVKTGTVPVAVYYGFGATLMLAAMYLAFRKKREEA